MPQLIRSRRSRVAESSHLHAQDETPEEGAEHCAEAGGRRDASPVALARAPGRARVRDSGGQASIPRARAHTTSHHASRRRRPQDPHVNFPPGEACKTSECMSSGHNVDQCSMSGICADFLTSCCRRAGPSEACTQEAGRWQQEAKAERARVCR